MMTIDDCEGTADNAAEGPAQRRVSARKTENGTVNTVELTIFSGVPWPSQLTILSVASQRSLYPVGSSTFQMPPRLAGADK